MTMTTLTQSVTLPDDYNRADFLSFHQRDRQAFAERVTANSLKKAMFWQRQPACLSIDFVADKAHAQLILDAEPDSTSAQAKDWPAWLEYFLGL